MKKALLFLLLLAGCARQSQTPLFVHAKPKKTIVIDAGHGGKDPGTISKRYDYEEKQLTLNTAFLVERYLAEMGYRVVLTRNHDTYIPLDTRAEIANTLTADLFVSIHYNYSPNQEAHGIEIFYYKDRQAALQSKQLGHDVLHQLTHQIGAHSRGVKHANFAVIRQTKMPAILIECGFLSNPQERAKLKSPKYRHFMARAIALGIDSHICKNF